MTIVPKGTVPPVCKIYLQSGDDTITKEQLACMYIIACFNDDLRKHDGFVPALLSLIYRAQ